MIHLHSTKKLLGKLPIDEHGLLPEHPATQRLHHQSTRPDNPLNNWHGNLLTIQRRNCLLLIHDETRFPLFIPCLIKPDFAALDYHFEDSLMNTLLKCGATEQQMNTAHLLLEPLQVDTHCNRSVLGTLNRTKGDIEHALWFDNVSITDISGYRVGAWMADTPCRVKGLKDFIWPREAMLALLDKTEASSC